METAALGELAHSVDFSITSLFLRAHWVVQAVMVILFLASFFTWAIIIEKLWRLRQARQRAEAFEKAFWSGQSLDELYDTVDEEDPTAMERVFVAGMREWRRSFDSNGALIPGARERIDRAMDVAVGRVVETSERWMGFLATTGAIAPFVGLFGTVWGIKNSFESIAVSQSTNLAVVAPGIAEALVATAFGLAAAIPAVIAYNSISDAISRFGGRLEGFADEFSTLLSRQLERRGR